MSQPAVRQSNKQPRSTPVFILYSWNFDLFWTSLQTYVAAGWGPYLVIVDNSQDRRVLHDAKVGLPCRCPESQNDNSWRDRSLQLPRMT